MKLSLSKTLLSGVLLCAGILLSNIAGAQSSRSFEPGYYRSPLNLDILLSANFAEARTDHFHSGIDIKTQGVEGKPLYAVADGYIARVNIAPWGYGRALYIAHTNGTTSVYAHMQWFTPAIEQWVDSQRHSLKRHSGDFYTEASPATPKFPLKKGDFIGYAGNSGSSLGPHLHFEIRQTASQRVLNVVKLGIYDIKDDIPPMIVKLHYIEVDTVRGVPVHAQPRSLEVRNTSRGKYVLADTSVLEIGPKGYFVLEATDRKNNTHNTMGVYSARMKIDGDQVFAFYLDNFLFDQTRYVNSLTHYAMQKGSRNELLRLAVQANNRLPAYSGVRNQGAVLLRDNVVHNIAIDAEDDNANISQLSLRVRLRPGGNSYYTDAGQAGIPVDCRKAFTRSVDGASVSIPANALYEPIFYTQNTEEPQTKGPVNRYSPVYKIHDDRIPLHSAITVSIDAPLAPQDLRSKLCLAKVSDDGTKYSYIAGKYDNGRVTGTTRTFGRYTVVADNTAPTITPSFTDSADLRGKPSMAFTLRDDFSGVASFSATIDGKWIPFEQQRGVVTYHFNDSRFDFKGTTHNLVITATDNKGNSTTLRRTFIR